jgi:hypothetical protein
MIEQPLDVPIRAATAVRPSMRCNVVMGEVPRWAAERPAANHRHARSSAISVGIGRDADAD